VGKGSGGNTGGQSEDDSKRIANAKIMKRRGKKNRVMLKSNRGKNTKEWKEKWTQKKASVGGIEDGGKYKSGLRFGEKDFEVEK